MGPKLPSPKRRKDYLSQEPNYKGPEERLSVHGNDMAVGDMVGSDLIEGDTKEGDTKER